MRLEPRLEESFLTIADNLVAGNPLDVASIVTVVSLLHGFRVSVSGYHLRAEANATGIFLELRVVKTLLQRQSTGP